jgi:hypothetical protein
MECAGRNIFFLLANENTGGGQNNGKTRQYKNKRVYVGCTAVSIICPSPVCVQNIQN